MNLRYYPSEPKNITLLDLRYTLMDLRYTLMDLKYTLMDFRYLNCGYMVNSFVNLGYSIFEPKVVHFSTLGSTCVILIYEHGVLMTLLCISLVHLRYYLNAWEMVLEWSLGTWVVNLYFFCEPCYFLKHKT